MRVFEAVTDRLNAALWKSSKGLSVQIEGGAGQPFGLESTSFLHGTARLTSEQETKTVPASQVRALDSPVAK